MTDAKPTDMSAAAAEEEAEPWDNPAVRAEEKGLGSFRFAVLFLALYYVRPQDWIGGLEGFNVIRPVMFGWILVILMQGGQSSWRSWFRSPHDWAIAAFYAYVWWNAPGEANAGSGMFSMVVFYVLTLHALSKWEYLLGYLKAWNAFLVIIAAFGVLQSLGLDITHGKDYTESNFGRLALGTWLANNPNALGHTVVVVLPLSYLLYFWNGSAAGRMYVFPLCATLAAWCAWLTESKGSFLVGAMLFMLVFIIGRSRMVQIFTLLAALTAGVGVLKFLPRMEQIGNLRADEGVMGRLLAWEQAKMTMESTSTGVGWKQFVASIQWQDGDNFYDDIPISTHSSYVQVGADLGKYGMFFWLLPLCVALRSVIFFKSRSEVEERCRRAALIILIAYMTSGWMINRQYHTEYFLVVALAAAIHRLSMDRQTALEVPEGEVETPPAADDTSTPPGPALAGLQWSRSSPEEDSGVWLEALPVAAESGAGQPRRLWTRLDWRDMLVCLAATLAVFEMWDYIMHNL